MTIEKLKTEFIEEALTAPKLFNDVAKVEEYIAESYRTRALVELIQNADDAGSSKFGIHALQGGFLVGNNGKTFNIEDVQALCRSGSSNKKRGSSTIGYRGIGFKSVVNIAKKILVISGEYKFTFDRKRTKNVLDSSIEVPLIRIPHSLDSDDVKLENEVQEIINSFGYKTVFIFQEIVEEISSDEFHNLDKSSLLFLKNVRKLYVDYNSIQRNIIVTHFKENGKTTIKVEENDIIDEWLIQYSLKNEIDLIAFKIKNGEIIPALLEESVIHSFTPTNEFAGAFIKINGDYTTDPSRKSVNFDELSQTAFKNAVTIIVETIIEIINGDLTHPGFFTPFTNPQIIESTKFKNLLFKSLESELQQKNLINSTQKVSGFASLRIKPEWLNFEDYEKICQDGLTSINKQLISTYPEISTFLKSINTKVLNLEDILTRINSLNLSAIGYAQIFVKIVNQFRYDLEKINQLRQLKLFPTKAGILSSFNISSTEEI